MDAADLASLSEEQVLELAKRMGLLGGNAPVEEDDGILVHPTPGFVVKTATGAATPAAGGAKGDAAAAVPAGRKVFINICSSEHVPTLQKMKALKEDGSGEEQEGVRVPVSVGPLKTDADHAGADCSVVDVVVHPDVIRDCDRDGTGEFKRFLVQLAMQYVTKKHSLPLTLASFTLPKVAGAYKGSGGVSAQRLRRKAAVAGIAEVDASGSGSRKAAGAAAGAGGASTSSSGGGSSSSSGPSPLTLLAQAGAVAQAAVPYNPVAAALASRGGGAAAAAAAAGGGMRGAVASAAPVELDIRVLDPDRDNARARLGREAEEALRSGTGAAAGGGPAGSGVVAGMLSGSGKGPAADGSGLLQAVSTTAVAAAPLPPVPVLPLELHAAVVTRPPSAATGAADAGGGQAVSVPVSIVPAVLPSGASAPGAAVDRVAATLTPAPPPAAALVDVDAADTAGAAVAATRGILSKDQAEGIVITLACRPVALAARPREAGSAAAAPDTTSPAADARTLSKALLPADVSVSLAASRDSLSVSVAGYQPLEIALPFVVLAADASKPVPPGVVRLHQQQRTLQIILRRDVSAVADRLQPLPVALGAALAAAPTDAPASLLAAASAMDGSGSSTSAAVAPSLSRPVLLSLLRSYVDAGADVDGGPDPGSKQWLVQQALAGGDSAASSAAGSTKPAASKRSSDATAAAPGAKKPSRPGGDDHDDEFPEDRFLRQDALSMHFIRQREEEKERRREKQQQAAAARAAAAGAASGDARDDGPTLTGASSGPAPASSSVAAPPSADEGVFDLV